LFIFFLRRFVDRLIIVEHTSGATENTFRDVFVGRGAHDENDKILSATTEKVKSQQDYGRLAFQRSSRD